MLLKKYKVLVPALIILSLIAAYATHSMFTTSTTEAFAHISFEVNPKITMTVDSSEEVITVELQNEEARQIFTEQMLVGKDINDALKLVANKLYNSGYLSKDSQIFLFLQPAEGVKTDELTGVSERVFAALKAELETRNLYPEVGLLLLNKPAQNAAQYTQTTESAYEEDDSSKNNLLTSVSAVTNSLLGTIDVNDITTWNRNIEEAYKDMLAAGFTSAEALEILKRASLVNPDSREIYEIASGFVDMKDVGIPFTVSRAIFDMGNGLDQTVFRQEISTLTSDLIDMREIGISSETAINALLMAIAANRSLYEVGSIISDIIDLKEAGVPDAKLLSLASGAIGSVPTLIKSDDHIDNSYRDDNNDGDDYEYDSDDNDDNEDDR